VNRGDQLGRRWRAEQRQCLVYLLAGGEQRREPLPVFLRTFGRGDERVPGALGPAEFCPQLANALLLTGGQGAADGAAQLRDPVLQGVECFLHDTRPYQSFQSFPDNPIVSWCMVRESPLTRRVVLFLSGGDLLMRLLHTSDWHLGRTVGQRPRDGDFDAVLAEITGIARDARPDLIVHSGDLFDSYRPGAPDLARCLHALRDLSEIAPVVVVAGNHDSPMLMEVLDFAVTAFGAETGPGGVRRLKFVARARRPCDGGILDYPARDGDQRIRVAALPFIHQNRFLDEFTSPASATRDYARHLREVEAALERGLLDGCQPDRDVLVFAAHLYVQGAIPSYTERPIEISDTYLTEAGALPAVSYAALGHIHRPQAITRAGMTARYAGSPLQLDFGEAGEDKSVVVVDADPGRPVRVELVPLRAGRRLADFVGTLEELRAQAGQIGDAFVRAVIVSEEPIPHLAAAAKDAAPQATFVAIDPRCAASQVAVLDRTEAEGEEPGLPDLFAGYLTGRVPSGAVADDILTTFSALLADIDREDPGIFREEAQLQSILGDEPAQQPPADGLLIPAQGPRGNVAAEVARGQA